MKKGFLYAKGVKIICTAALLLFAFGISNVPAAGTTNIAIVPSSVEIANVGLIESINVTVTNVTNLYSWQIIVYYDNTVVNCTGAWLPADHVFAGQTFVEGYLTLEEDYVAYGCSLVNPPTFNGTGVLCSINFTGLALGNSDLTFGMTGAIITRLIGYPPEDIEFEAIDGEVTVVPEFPAFMLVPLLMIATIAAVILVTKGRLSKTKTSRPKQH